MIPVHCFHSFSRTTQILSEPFSNSIPVVHYGIFLAATCEPTVRIESADTIESEEN